MGPFTRCFFLFVLSVGWGLFPQFVFAQFETETPTFTPTPKFAITGTPQISTMWLGAGHDPLSAAAPTATPGTVDMDLSDSSMGTEVAPKPAPTPGHGKGSGNGTGQGSGSGSGVGQGNGVGTGTGMGSGMGDREPMVKAKKGAKVGQGPRMLDLYEAGIENYKAKDYDSAINYLEQALTIQDKSVPDYYYAEANAMLAVIYKFDRPDNALAHRYCDAALKIDPATLTAKKLQYEIDSNGTETEKVYTQAMAAYKKCHYDEALPILEQVANTQDPTTPSFYYGEAAKTAGIIYQYVKKDEEKAVHYYRLALKYQPKDPLARHNLNQLEAEH